MNVEDLYKGFTPEKQKFYEEELVSKHNVSPNYIEKAREHLGNTSEVKMKDKMSELRDIEADIIFKMQDNVPSNSDMLDTIISHHKSWVTSMWGWECDLEAYKGLADIYRATPSFVERYESLAKGLSDYLCEAMHAYAERKM